MDPEKIKYSFDIKLGLNEEPLLSSSDIMMPYLRFSK